MNFNFNEDILTFGIVLKMRTVKHKHIIKKILCKAIDENRVEQKLKEINEVWVYLNNMSISVQNDSK